MVHTAVMKYNDKRGEEETMVHELPLSIAFYTYIKEIVGQLTIT